MLQDRRQPPPISVAIPTRGQSISLQLGVPMSAPVLQAAGDTLDPANHELDSPYLPLSASTSMMVSPGFSPMSANVPMIDQHLQFLLPTGTSTEIDELATESEVLAAGGSSAVTSFSDAASFSAPAMARRASAPAEPLQHRRQHSFPSPSLSYTSLPNLPSSSDSPSSLTQSPSLNPSVPLQPYALPEVIAVPSSSTTTTTTTTSAPTNLTAAKPPDALSSTTSPKEMLFINATLESLKEQLLREEQIPKKKRLRKSSHQVCALERAFEENPMPGATFRQALADRLGMSTRAVQIWRGSSLGPASPSTSEFLPDTTVLKSESTDTVSKPTAAISTNISSMAPPADMIMSPTTHLANSLANLMSSCTSPVPTSPSVQMLSVSSPTVPMIPPNPSTPMLANLPNSRPPPTSFSPATPFYHSPYETHSISNLSPAAALGLGLTTPAHTQSALHMGIPAQMDVSTPVTLAYSSSTSASPMLDIFAFSPMPIDTATVTATHHGVTIKQEESGYAPPAPSITGADEPEPLRRVLFPSSSTSSCPNMTTTSSPDASCACSCGTSTDTSTTGTPYLAPEVPRLFDETEESYAFSSQGYGVVSSGSSTTVMPTTSSLLQHHPSLKAWPMDFENGSGTLTTSALGYPVET
ncbi:hypothetical protein HK102_004854, partial [Quaeritorhiza haematococci]